LWYGLAFKVTASMSNMPGPAQPLQLAGRPIEKLVFFVPPSRTIGHFLTILSYNGRVMFGLASDQKLVENPKEILQYFADELSALAVSVGLEPIQKI